MKERAIRKVCFCIPIPPPYGGIANWSKIIMEHLDSSVIDAAVIDTSPKSRVTEGRSALNRVMFGGLTMLKCIIALHKKIKLDRPDVIHITTSGHLSLIRDYAFLFLAKKNGIPAIYHIRIGRLKDILKSTNWERKLFEKTISLASRIIAIDQTTYNAIRAHFPQKSAVCIPNPVSFDDMPPLNTEQDNEILFIGWIIKEKGIEELLTAWGELSALYPQWRLGLVGPVDKIYYADIASRFNLDKVTLYGEKDHAKTMQKLNRSAILILPSYTEGFPNVVVEAMALGKPVIATKVGAVPEMLDNECGEPIEPKDINGLKAAMIKLMGDAALRSVYGCNARAKAMERYSLDVVMKQYLQEWHR